MWGLLITVAWGHVLPDRVDTRVERATWSVAGGWRVAPAEAGPGSRLAVWAETSRELALEARGWVGDQPGAWRPVETTHQSPGLQIAILDFGTEVDLAELRYPAEDEAALEVLRWEVLSPRYPDAGVISRAPSRSAALGVLPPELVAIGVVSRAGWGARPTTCTSTEDDWYRMAIHHTAGSQTSGGTVQGAVVGLQAYSMDSGEYCDTPYQFTVGFDGSLWEGRPYNYYSGATGGNNDGNIAISWLGCYHPSDCPTSHPVDERMISAGQRLVQTLAGLHAIPSDSGSVKGHRDWPGNATACPGDWLHARIPDLLAPLGPAWSAALTASSAPLDGSAPLVVPLGGEAPLSLTFQNLGSGTWEPGTTFLATLPRDVGSLYAASGWVSPTRLVTVDRTVLPGESGTFVTSVAGPTLGSGQLDLALVQEWVAWFPDDGGPAEGSLRLAIEVVEDPGPDTGGAGGGDETGAPGPDTGPEADNNPDGEGGGDGGGAAATAGYSPRVPLSDLGCRVMPGGAVGGWWLALALALGRRRAAAS